MLLNTWASGTGCMCGLGTNNADYIHTDYVVSTNGILSAQRRLYVAVVGCDLLKLVISKDQSFFVMHINKPGQIYANSPSIYAYGVYIAWYKRILKMC
jgi:hypothetical protein